MLFIIEFEKLFSRESYEIYDLIWNKNYITFPIYNRIVSFLLKVYQKNDRALFCVKILQKKKEGQEGRKKKNSFKP